MKLQLMYLDSYDFTPKDKKDKKYKIYTFVDPQSLTIITGNNLGADLKEYELYNCKVELKSNKLKVTSIV